MFCLPVRPGTGLRRPRRISSNPWRFSIAGCMRATEAFQPCVALNFRRDTTPERELGSPVSALWGALGGRMMPHDRQRQPPHGPARPVRPVVHEPGPAGLVPCPQPLQPGPDFAHFPGGGGLPKTWICSCSGPGTPGPCCRIWGSCGTGDFIACFSSPCWTIPGPWSRAARPRLFLWLPFRNFPVVWVRSGLSGAMTRWCAAT